MIKSSRSRQRIARIAETASVDTDLPDMKSKRKPRLLHIITSLGAGGAQAMLYKLLEQYCDASVDHAVLQLVGGGIYSSRLRDIGIPVHSLNLHAGRPSVRAIWALKKLLKEHRADVVQGWMYHGNLVAEFAKTLSATEMRSVWNIRHSIHSMSDEKALTRWIIRFGARLSHRPARIIYNSRVSASQHESLGYENARRLVIANGFDTDRFRFSAVARHRVRSNLRVADHTFLVGMVARNHPIKDHNNLVESAALLEDRHIDIQYVLAGLGTDALDASKRERIERAGLTRRFHLLGEYDDVPSLMSAFDVLVLPSRGEAFPNVLGEAMACERPCIASDVGDCAEILGDCGIIIPPRSPSALADAIFMIYRKSQEERRSIGTRARYRIKQYYALPHIVAQYSALYQSILTHKVLD